MGRISKNAQTVLAIGGVVIVLGFLVTKKFGAGVDAIQNVNVGTPFEGAGVVGVVGNITNVASGGILAAIGSGLGEFFSGLFDTRTVDDLTGGTVSEKEFFGPPAPG